MTEATWPKTVEEAVYVLDLLLDDDYREKIKNTPEHNLNDFHFSLGLSIRNRFGVWDNNLELLESCGSMTFQDQWLSVTRQICAHGN